MNGFPKSEWEYLLRSQISLSDHLSFRFDGNGNRCLYDLRRAQMWRLEPWQSRFLDQLHRGSSFPAAVQHVVTEFPLVANRESISDLVRSLRLLGSLKVGRLPRHEKRLSRVPDHSHGREGSPSRGVGLPIAWVRRMAAGLGIVSLVGWGLGTAFSWGELAEARQNRLVDEYPAIRKVEKREVELSETLGVRVWTAGVIQSVLIDVGDEVRQGQVIARVADPLRDTIRNDLRLSLGESKALRDLAYQTGDVATYLTESRSIAKLTRELSRWDSEDSESDLVAPVDGRISSLEIGPLMVGHRVQPGDVIGTIDSTLSPEHLAVVHHP